MRNGSQFLGVIGQILRYAFSRGFHAGLALAPAGRTDFSVLFGELQRVHDAQHFVDVAPQRQVVYYLMAHDTGTVDQE